jgi:hypothetical protein
MQGKDQKEIPHSSNSTQISSGFPFCFYYGPEVAGIMDSMLYLYRPYSCITGKLLTGI